MKQTRDIRGKAHCLVVLHVKGKDELGRPKEATVLYDEDSVQLQGGDEFVTAWVPEHVIDKRGKN